MRRGIGRLRAGGAQVNAFNPLTLFAASGKGVWYDQSDAATVFQDSGGTTPGVLTQPVGKRLDKSGNANHATQATAAARPTWQQTSSIYYDQYDGVDDGMNTAVVGAGVFSATTDIFIAAQRLSGASGILIGDSGGSHNWLNTGAGASSCMTAEIGTAWSVFVNGVIVGGVNSCTGNQLNAALGTGVWKVVEVRDADMSSWINLALNSFSGFPGLFGQVIVCPVKSAGVRAQTRTYVGSKVGLSL